MSATSELSQFHEFVRIQLQSGGTLMTPEQCLELWRHRNSSSESAAALADVRAALKEMDEGDVGVPAREFVRSLRSGGPSASLP